MRHRQIFLVYLFLAWLMQPSLADGVTVTPGVGIDGVNLGMERITVHERLGKPRDAVPGGSVEYYDVGRSKDQTLNVIYDGRGQVTALQIEPAIFQTRNGLSHSSTLRDVRKIYPHLKPHRYGEIGDGWCMDLDAVQAGIGFCFYQAPDAIGNDKYKPRNLTGTEHPTRIVVHRRGVYAPPYISSY